MENSLHITNLRSGGIICNYYCSSKCAHCLYGCSPGWKKEFIQEDVLKNVTKKILAMGCRSVHIGGGEPLLKPLALKTVLKTTRAMGLGIDYVETNSSWFRTEEEAVSMLLSLKEHGLNSLLLSISPFHNEFIPLKKVKGVMRACQKAGVAIFPWISDFLPEIEKFDDNVCHTLNEYEELYGQSYLKKIPSRYWIHFGGRALNTFSNYFPGFDYEEIIANNPDPCMELSDTNHFHFDLFGGYIPGLCAGLSINYHDLGKPIAYEKYPIIATLFLSGINGLFKMAIKKSGFKTQKKFISKCHLCLEIRSFLALKNKSDFPELRPENFYENL
ncbi:radical SAM protein [Candidatus Riflebacteria bacterium]